MAPIRNSKTYGNRREQQAASHAMPSSKDRAKLQPMTGPNAPVLGNSTSRPTPRKVVTEPKVATKPKDIPFFLITPANVRHVRPKTVKASTRSQATSSTPRTQATSSTPRTQATSSTSPAQATSSTLAYAQPLYEPDLPIRLYEDDGPCRYCGKNVIAREGVSACWECIWDSCG